MAGLRSRKAIVGVGPPLNLSCSSFLSPIRSVGPKPSLPCKSPMRLPPALAKVEELLCTSGLPAMLPPSCWKVVFPAMIVFQTVCLVVWNSESGTKSPPPAPSATWPPVGRPPLAVLALIVQFMSISPGPTWDNFRYNPPPWPAPGPTPGPPVAEFPLKVQLNIRPEEADPSPSSGYWARSCSVRKQPWSGGPLNVYRAPPLAWPDLVAPAPPWARLSLKVQPVIRSVPTL